MDTSNTYTCTRHDTILVELQASPIYVPHHHHSLTLGSRRTGGGDYIYKNIIPCLLLQWLCQSMEHQPTTTPTSITPHALATLSTPVLAHSHGVGWVGATVPTWMAEEEGSGRLVGRGYHIIKQPWVRRSPGLWWSCLLWCCTWHAPTRPSSSHSITDYYNNKNIRLPFIYFHPYNRNKKYKLYSIAFVLPFHSLRLHAWCIVFTTCANSITPPASISQSNTSCYISYEYMLPIYLTLCQYRVRLHPILFYLCHYSMRLGCMHIFCTRATRLQDQPLSQINICQYM